MSIENNEKCLRCDYTRAKYPLNVINFLYAISDALLKITITLS